MPRAWSRGQGQQGGGGDEGFDKHPEVIVATEPTEVIWSDGEPTWTPVRNTGLLSMSNTDSDVFLHISEQQNYTVVAGRWYRAGSMDGPWEFVQSDQLPTDFATILPASDQGHVLAFVGGTVQAEDAVRDTYIPQTAAIDRSSAKVDVTYDGKPEFKPIEGTKMGYGVNTTYAVVRSGRRYYCCNEAVWFWADRATGPWFVADAIPDEIYTIPPSCPIYNVKYVHIYDSTPQVVYVGYTPGYTGSYVTHSTVVYGTGYVYAGYYSPTVVVTYPVTYGYAPVYRPYAGWGLAVGFTAGWIAGNRWGGWYGGRRGDVDINIDNSINIGNRNRGDNVYNRGENRDRLTDRDRDRLDNRDRDRQRGDRHAVEPILEQHIEDLVISHPGGP